MKKVLLTLLVLMSDIVQAECSKELSIFKIITQCDNIDEIEAAIVANGASVASTDVSLRVYNLPPYIPGLEKIRFSIRDNQPRLLLSFPKSNVKTVANWVTQNYGLPTSNFEGGMVSMGHGSHTAKISKWDAPMFKIVVSGNVLEDTSILRINYRYYKTRDIKKR